MDDRSPPLHDPPAAAAPSRPRYRVPVGIPTRDEGRRMGAVVSVLIHAAIIGLLIVPFFLPSSVIRRIQQGAGGAGPAGGGGGGNRGSGGTVETLRFVKVSTQPVPTPTSLPSVPAPVPPPVARPVPKPVETPAATPQEQVVKPAPAAPASSSVAGAGGGSGTDGSAGAGPGSGGGVGSGAGTGRGSADGPGTGGGTQANYSPQVKDMMIPPLPPPARVRGMQVVAEFDVDSTGRVLDFRFTETPDGAYNRQIATTLRSLRFRPGTRPDGTPIRMKAQLTYNF